VDEQVGLSIEQQVERLHAVLLGRVMRSVVHAGVVRGCVRRGAGLFRPRAREGRCRPARPAVMSEQSRGRNNRCCSDVGTTPNMDCSVAMVQQRRIGPIRARCESEPRVLGASFWRVPEPAPNIRTTGMAHGHSPSSTRRIEPSMK
jgi:hypothetical protein